MHGDRQWDVKEQFPIVVGIRSVLGDIDLLWKVIDLNKVIFSWIIEGFEKVLLEPILPCCVQHARQRVFIQLCDQFANEGVEEVLECVRELSVPMS